MPNTDSDTTQKSQTDQPNFTTQEGWDQAFGGITQGVGPSQQMTHELLRAQGQAYWRLAEDTLRTAREIGEHQMLFAYRQQISQEAAAVAASQVIGYLRQNPQLVQQLVQQGQPQSR